MSQTKSFFASSLYGPNLFIFFIVIVGDVKENYLCKE